MNSIPNLRSFLKFLSRNKMYTAIDLFGLSVSLMFVILITVYTVQELSTDHFQEKADRIYVMGSPDRYELAYGLSYHLQERYPEIEKVCPMVASTFEGYPVYQNEHKYNVNPLFADTTFFDFFSFPLISGSREQALSAKNYAVISETFARKAFPGGDPMGQAIRVNDSLTVVVNGVMKDIRNSVIPYADLLIRIDNVHYLNRSLRADDLGNAGSAVNFVMVRPGTNIQSRAEDTAEWLRSFFWVYERGLSKQVIYTPLRDIYFGDISTWTLNRGDWKFVIILMSVGILILIFAVINYVNLTVAQTGFRAKEMATRRLMGSSRGELFQRLVMESTLLCFIAFLGGLFLAFAAAPSASNLLQTKIDLLGAITPFSCLIALVAITVIGGVAGLLPALVISNTKPIEVVRGSFRAKTKMVFSKFFITFQNVITIVLVASALTMILQIDHMLHAPLGYNTKNIIDINAWAIGSREQGEAFMSELGQQSCVNRVALAEDTPMGGQNNWSTQYEGQNISFQQMRGDQTFFDMLGFQMVRDNHVADSENGWYFNRQAIREMGVQEDIQFVTLGGQTFPVLGIMEDIQLGNITRGKQAILFRILKPDQVQPFSIMVEVNGDPVVAMKTVKDIYERVTHLDFNGKFIDQQVEESFASQRRMSKIISVFTVIAILISLLGLLAMSTYFIQQRSLEVAVRKVFGSSRREVLVKLVRTFLNYVGIAFVIAIPVIWYFMGHWLADYSYRIPLSPLIFVAAGLFCFLISFITVFFQSLRAANSNPVEIFRNKM